MAADHVEVLERPEALDRSLGDIHPGGNPHVHLDPRNIAILAEVLAGRLEQVDPERAEAYRQRLASFQARWADAVAGWQERTAELARHEGDRLITRLGSICCAGRNWTGLRCWSGFRGRSADSVASRRGSAEGAEQRRQGPFYARPSIPMTLRSGSPGKTGIPAVELPFTVGGRPEATDLFSLFDSTLALLEEARDRS